MEHSQWQVLVLEDIRRNFRLCMSTIKLPSRGHWPLTRCNLLSTETKQETVEFIYFENSRSLNSWMLSVLCKEMEDDHEHRSHCVVEWQLNEIFLKILINLDNFLDGKWFIKKAFICDIFISWTVWISRYRVHNSCIEYLRFLFEVDFKQHILHIPYIHMRLNFYWMAKGIPNSDRE